MNVYSLKKKEEAIVQVDRYLFAYRQSVKEAIDIIDTFLKAATFTVEKYPNSLIIFKEVFCLINT